MTNVLVCGACRMPLSRPVNEVPDLRLVDAKGWGTRVPQGIWAAVAGPSPFSGVSNEGKVWIHPHDLIASQVVPSGFGCCGYSPHDGTDNLKCRCGAPVGILVDECSCAIEVALAAVWASAEELPVAAGVSERLDRFACSYDAGGAQRCLESTYWGFDRVDCSTPGDIAFVLRDGPGEPRVELLADGRPIVLAMSRMVLARAVALIQLPVGDGRLVVANQVLDDGNRVIVETWALVRRGEDIDVMNESQGSVRCLTVPGELLEIAWRDAVAGWQAN